MKEQKISKLCQIYCWKNIFLRCNWTCELVIKLRFVLCMDSFLSSILPKQSWCKSLHCNPLQGNYRVELLHREKPVVITGNEFAEYRFLLFWLHFFPCFNNIEIVALVPVMCTGNCQFILQGLNWRVALIPCNLYRIVKG